MTDGLLWPSQDNAIGRPCGAKSSTASTAIVRMCIRRGTHSSPTGRTRCTRSFGRFVLYRVLYRVCTVYIACRVSIPGTFRFFFQLSSRSLSNTPYPQRTTKPTPISNWPAGPGRAHRLHAQSQNRVVGGPFRGQLGITGSRKAGKAVLSCSHLPATSSRPLQPNHAVSRPPGH